MVCHQDQRSRGRAALPADANDREPLALCVSGLDVLCHEQASQALPRENASISRNLQAHREFFPDFSTNRRSLRVFVA
jgi:hypothetical protein